MPGPGEMKKPQPAPRPPEVPTATTLFKLTNPELMLDPRRRRSWLITGGVAAFFAVYLSWTFYWEAREAAAAQQRELQSAPPAAGAPPIGDVVKVPPPNRLAHCRQRPGATNRPYIQLQYCAVTSGHGSLTATRAPIARAGAAKRPASAERRLHRRAAAMSSHCPKAASPLRARAEPLSSARH